MFSHSITHFTHLLHSHHFHALSGHSHILTPPQVPVALSVGGEALSEVSFGQPVWTRGGDGLLVVGWPHQSSNFPNLAK